MYKLMQNSNFILRVADNTAIPPASANTDYQKYLQWLSEGNEPLPADEVTE
jgi:hypothetical protein